MQSKMRRNFAGTFTAQETGQGAWHLSRAQPSEHPLEIFLHGADARAFAASGAALTELSVEWQGARALLSLLCAGSVASVAADSIIVHEPLDGLYRALPLAEFDRQARRFWQRVFLLVRIPGGRRLLHLMAHLNRKRR